MEIPELEIDENVKNGTGEEKETLQNSPKRPKYNENLFNCPRKLVLAILTNDDEN